MDSALTRAGSSLTTLWFCSPIFISTRLIYTDARTLKSRSKFTARPRNACSSHTPESKESHFSDEFSSLVLFFSFSASLSSLGIYHTEVILSSSDFSSLEKDTRMKHRFFCLFFFSSFLYSCMNVNILPVNVGAVKSGPGERGVSREG